ncbi:MAG: TraB domain-containing protein [Candidatus Woesearchaeota archaeon]
MITLLGTNHISPRSIHVVRQAISDYDIIGVELDKHRLQKLFSQPKNPSFIQLTRAVGVSGAIFAKIGHYVEHKLGAQVGTLPGDEMRAAIQEAAIHKKLLVLIDQPIHITLQRFSKAFTWRVKWRLIKLLFKKNTSLKQLNPYGVPDEKTTKELMKVLEENLPELAAVLVHERNTYMTRILTKLQEQHPEKNILAVVGAGHVPGMNEELNNKNIPVTVYEQ